MTPALLAAYRGAVGNGYKPAFEAVQIIRPREAPWGSNVGFLFM